MRYESRLAKRDEALAIQNKVSAEQTVHQIEALYGPIKHEEIEWYRRRLTENGSTLINNFQMNLIGYLYYKDFGDPITFYSLHNETDYIKLLICGNRMLRAMGMVLLPYIISGKVVRQATRKIISKKDISKYERSTLYAQIKQKYNNNEKILNKVWEFIGMVSSSMFQIIDWDDEANKPTEYDGKIVPMINDIVYEEMLFFIAYI